MKNDWNINTQMKIYNVKCLVCKNEYSTNKITFCADCGRDTIEELDK